jgi:hypothetical protein
MSAKTFEKGQEVYDIHGRAGRYVGNMSGLHFVRPITQDEDGEEYLDEPQHWVDPLFNEPPTDKLHAEVAALEKRRNELQSGVYDLESKQRDLLRQDQERNRRLKNQPNLKRLDDVLAGKITHFVCEGRYSDIYTVKSVAEWTDRDGRKNQRLPLLVLYGDPYRFEGYRDPQWCILDSDEQYKKVLPCTSLEDAMQQAAEQYELMWARARSDMSRAYSLRSQVDAAKALGFPIPEDVAAVVAERDAAQRVKDLEKARQDLAKAQNAIAALEGGAG